MVSVSSPSSPVEAAAIAAANDVPACSSLPRVSPSHGVSHFPNSSRLRCDNRDQKWPICSPARGDEPNMQSPPRNQTAFLSPDDGDLFPYSWDNMNTSASSCVYATNFTVLPTSQHKIDNISPIGVTQNNISNECPRESNSCVPIDLVKTK